MAVKTGRAMDVDLYVIENIVSMLSENPDRSMKLFIKLSRQSVADHDFPVRIVNMLRDYNVSAEQLVFEISEQVMASELKNMSMLCTALCNLGCKVAIEHYRMSAGVQHLQHIHVDFIKIDSDLIQSMSSKGVYMSKITEIIEVSKKHGCQIIAEGVESPSSLAILYELGVNFAQGYLVQAPSAKLEYDSDEIVSEH
jgi:EAL domain-containing protein (putative c-di-GMP-specific phosphodiesterase class I)